MSVARDIEEAKKDALRIIGWEISEIINQPEEDEVYILDDIIKLLRQYNIYKEKV